MTRQPVPATLNPTNTRRAQIESFPYLLEVKESMEAGLWQSK